MKKLNNKGLTSIEILVCFSIVTVIVISMFKAINNYKDKQDLESYKNTVTTYKNTLTKAIEEDILKNQGITKAETVEIDQDQTTVVYKMALTLKNNIRRDLIVTKNLKCGNNSLCKNNTPEADELDYQNSSFYVEYNNEKFVLPKVYALQFNEVYLKEEDGFITIHIGLNHPDLGNKYDALNIITPNVSVYLNALGI